MDDANSKVYNGHALFDLSMEYRFRIYRNADIIIIGGIKNITDKHHASMILINAPSFGGRAPRYYYPGNPRNFYAGVRIVF